MFGARFAVFVRRARVLPTPCPATRNLSFLRFHRHRHTVVSKLLFRWTGTGLVRKFHKMEIAQTCTGMWRWCMSMFGARFAVFVRQARVLPTPCPATRNLSFSRFHRRRHPVVSTRNFYWAGTGWYENSTRWKSCKPVHEHVWRTLCSVCATGARVAHPVPCNS